jgi:hypothetical protein
VALLAPAAALKTVVDGGTCRERGEKDWWSNRKQHHLRSTDEKEQTHHAKAQHRLVHKKVAHSLPKSNRTDAGGSGGAVRGSSVAVDNGAKASDEKDKE